MRKFIRDAFLNILAFGLPLITIQIIILPLIAKKISVGDHGLLLSVIAFINLSAVTLGNSLNNARLIDKTKNRLSGNNYKRILIYFLFINLIMLSMSFIFFGSRIDYITYIFIVIYGSLMLYISYSTVKFRINLNYKNIIASNVFLVIGYIIGYFMFRSFERWELVYFTGSIFMFLYVFKNSKINEENNIVDQDFKTTSKHVLTILLSAVIISSITYADKLIVLPLLGEEAVAIIYVASFFAKLVTSFIPPINGVLLSYLSASSNLSLNKIYKYIWYLLILLIMAYLPIYLSSIIFTKYLYSSTYQLSLSYIPFSVAASLLLIYGLLLNTIILKFFKSKHYLIFNLMYLITYIGLSSVLSLKLGIYGYILGTLISSAIKVISLIVFITIKKGDINYGK